MEGEAQRAGLVDTRLMPREEEEQQQDERAERLSERKE